MKRWFLILSIFVLNACIGGCPIMAVVSCHSPDEGPDWLPIATFQKIGHFGHTDSEQRWRDVESCGAINISKKEYRFDIKNITDKDGSLNFEVSDKFMECMTKKGYQQLYYVDCGTMNPKYDKGKCNL